MPLAIGSRLGSYEIQAPLGAGGMGEVYRARDTRLGRDVALKVLSRGFVDDAEYLARFQREARNLATLSHPSIVTIFAVEEVDGEHVLAMEFIPGRTLRHVADAGVMPLERFFEVAIAMADAIAAAHERGVTHRDLKPENVMVTDSGRVKVLDFGLAKAPRGRDDGGEAPDTLTREGIVLGTLPYMSPEQAEGRPVDWRSDLFSLGVVFYELLTGGRPFTGETNARILSSILRDTPASVSALRPDVPPEVARLVRRCLHKEAAHRVQSALDVRNELQDLLDELRFRKLDSAARRAPASRRALTLDSRTGITLCLVLLLVIDWIETTTEATVRTATGWGNDLGYTLAGVMTWLERGLSFERHDLTNPIGIYAASLAYFVVPVCLVLATVGVLARRRDLAAYRTFALAVTIWYAVSLVFYLCFPVPERWAFASSEAVLLSDLWSVKLIQAFRPLSGLDNCFPSFHVSSAVDIALVWYVYRIPFRHSVACLSAAVVLSTFVLGIHWLADIAAGVALGIVSVVAALRFGRRTTSPRRSGLDTTTTADAGSAPAGTVLQQL